MRSYLVALYQASSKEDFFAGLLNTVMMTLLVIAFFAFAAYDLYHQVILVARAAPSDRAHKALALLQPASLIVIGLLWNGCLGRQVSSWAVRRLPTLSTGSGGPLPGRRRVRRSHFWKRAHRAGDS